MNLWVRYTPQQPKCIVVRQEKGYDVFWMPYADARPRSGTSNMGAAAVVDFVPDDSEGWACARRKMIDLLPSSLVLARFHAGVNTE